MQDEQYFIRRRGRVTGPYDFDTVRKMVQTGKLYKSDELSLDQVDWVTASETEFFPTPQQKPSQKTTNEGNEPYIEPETYGIDTGSNTSSNQRPGVAPPTNKEWHYAYADISFGPIKESELKQKFMTKEIAIDTKVWCEGMVDWEPADQIPTFKYFFKEVKYGKGKSNEMAEQDDMPYATFLQRVGAVLIDGLVVSLINTGVTIVIAILSVPFYFMAFNQRSGVNEAIFALVSIAGIGLWLVVSLIVGVFYFVIPVASPKMATLGKSSMGIYVCKTNGQQLGFGLALIRHFAVGFSNLILPGFIYLVPLFTAKKQAVHDLIVDSVVLQRNN